MNQRTNLLNQRSSEIDLRSSEMNQRTNEFVVSLCFMEIISYLCIVNYKNEEVKKVSIKIKG
jgi:hypothetical protein